MLSNFVIVMNKYKLLYIFFYININYYIFMLLFFLKTYIIMNKTILKWDNWLSDNNNYCSLVDPYKKSKEEYKTFLNYVHKHN